MSRFSFADDCGTSAVAAPAPLFQRRLGPILFTGDNGEFRRLVSAARCSSW